jgi:hypothetical protein
MKLSGLLLMVNLASSTWLHAYDENDFFPSMGEDELQQGLDLTTELLRMSQELGTSPNSNSYGTTSADVEKYKSRQMLNLIGKDKIKTSFWSKMNRDQRLTDHANLKLHYALNNEKIEMKKYYKRISQLRSNDGIIAKAWENSPTGKRDGRYWNQLTDPEKELMKKRYVQFHNPEIFEVERSFSLIIPESEYAMAWKLKNMNNYEEQPWEKIRDFETKNNFRKSYYSYKLASLSPQIKVSEEELAQAWEIAHIGSGNSMGWADVVDPIVRKKFRKNYIDLVHSGEISRPHREDSQMIASSNYNAATR